MPRRCLVFLCVLWACRQPTPEVDPAREAEGHYLAGQQAFHAGNFAAAHEAYGRVRALTPEEPRLLVAEGEVFLAEGRLDEALAAFERAAARNPRRPAAWSRLAALYALKGRTAEATDAARQALAVNPDDFNALEALGDVQLTSGDVDGGVGALAAAARAAPAVHQGALVMKAVESLSRVGRGAEALALLESLCEHASPSAELFSALGDRLVEVGRLADAVAAYTRAAKLDPADRGLLELIGELELKRGRLPQAEAAFTAALARQDTAVVHVALARVCQARKDRPCVERELDRALATATGEELRESYDLAELLAAVGRPRDALTLLKAVAEEPEQKDNVWVQRKTAQVARAVGDEAAVQQACRRALAAPTPPPRCP